MPTYYDSQNKSYVLTEQIGRGGEGVVFSCADDAEIVAKIYHEPVTPEKAEKLRWMADNKNEHLLKVAAWVIDVLRDAPGGKVVGFLMPNVRAKEIHELYSLKSRRVYFPEATWHFLIHTAANLARGFYSLHRDDHVMGDINHGNCVVLADGTVKLIDCDSYSISTGNFRYRCEVGVATHLAPELQGVDLGEATREAKHDNFGLAVIIFQLLFLGRHPFSGNYLGAQDKSLEDCIREKLFAYGDNTDIAKVKQPPGTLSLSEVSPRLAAMFERAFLTGDRPEPREWVEALEDFSRSLDQCNFHPGHHYYEKLAACPWCRIEGQTGLMLFPFINSANDLNGEKPFNIFTIENLIENLGINQNLPAKPIDPMTLFAPPPSPEFIDKKRDNRKRQITIIAIQFVLISVFMYFLGIGAGVFVGIVTMIFFIISLNNPDKDLRAELNESLFDAREKWNQIENEWSKGLVPQNVNDDLAQIRKKIDAYQKFQQTAAHKIKLLRDDVSRRHFSEYLRSFRLEAAEIPEIKAEDRRILIEKGIKTAAEIEEKRLLDFYQIDFALTKKLVAWRTELEEKFDFDADLKIPEAEQKQVIQESAGKRRMIEREIEQLFGSLRSASVYLRRQQQNLVAKSETISRELIQTESDLQALGNSSAAILVLILVTFMTPFWGGIIGEVTSSGANYKSSYPNTGITTRPVPATKVGSGTVSAVTVAPMPTLNLDLPDDDITDREIAELSPAKRSEYSSNLLLLAENAAERIDYEAAEKHLRFALRFNAEDIYTLNKLGYSLYSQKKYEESLKILNRSLMNDPKYDETNNFIGINYLEMKRFKDARRIFTDLTKDENLTNITIEHFYNLGLAHKGLNDYKSAVEVFRQVISFDSDHVDAHYELGYCLYKTGDTEGAWDQYRLLLEKDETMANKLFDTLDLGKGISRTGKIKDQMEEVTVMGSR